MKFLISLIMLASFQAMAAPVLNRNMAAAGNRITIWPDHTDPNHFYYAPSSFNIAMGQDQKPIFNMIDYEIGNCGRFRRCSHKSMLTTYFEAGYRESELLQAQNSILKFNPKARFSQVPFISSRVDFGTALTPFIDDHNCSPRAGQPADLVPCTIILNAKGIQRLKPNLKEGKMMAFNFVYQIYGVVEGSNPQYKDHTAEYSIAVNLGGDVLIGHADLED